MMTGRAAWQNRADRERAMRRNTAEQRRGPLVNGRRKPKPKLRQTALGIVLLLVGIAAGDALRFIDLRLVQAVSTAIVADYSGLLQMVEAQVSRLTTLRVVQQYLAAL